MKWDQIEITGNDNIIHKGEKARKFVEANCPNASIRTYSAGKISVELPEGTSVKPEIVRGHLEDILHGKAKGLKVKIGGKPIVVNFPVGRAVKNVVNVNLAKLKVQFIYKRDPEDLSPKKFLEDERVTVKALREGSTNPLIKVTNKGIADFGVVIPGKYTITFSDLDECKYDWTDETRNVVLQPLSVETIEFQVEPLYQQVQFIAHCLATIPHQTFVKTVEDDEMLEVGDSGGKRTFKFKIKRKDMGKWSFGLLDPAVKNKATYQALKKELTMKSKGVGLEFWSIDDIKDGIKDKLEYTGQKLGDPNTYVGITFKPRFEESEYTAGDLTGKWKGKYHGDVDDIKDITARVKFIEDTLEKSYNKSDKKPTVLKVFMVPECYFQGLYGAYISDDAAELVEKLQNAVKDKKWKDWIFSFGTVNREFLGLQPKIVTAEANKTIYEMANHAPVIRGGLGDPKSSAGDSTRLIQKLINSAELADEGELIRDPVVTELLRKKEEMLEKAALKTDIAIEEMVKEGKFKDETYLIDGYEAKRIRRQAVNEEVQFEATENDNEVAELLEKLLGAELKDSFGLRPNLEAEIKEEIKKLGIARVARQIRVSADDDVFFKWREKLKVYEKRLDEQKELEWKERLEEAESLEEPEKSEEKEKVRKEQEEQKSKKPVSFAVAKGGMSLDDYVFACPRKAGPLFKTLDEAKKVKACKRLVFGLEICADHGDQRIIQINTGPNQIDIDIHLVPSAGQKPRNFATRIDGYVFNCDGWNQQPEGGRIIETHLDGPSPFTKKVAGLDKPVSPISPHSAVIKRETDEILVGVKICLAPEKTETPNAELSKVIFGYGPGEIHFYPLLELPK